MDITQQLALPADRLRAIAGSGLHFARNPCDELVMDRAGR